MKVYLAGEGVAQTPAGQEALWYTQVKRRLFSYYYHGYKNGNKPTDEVLYTAKTGREMFLDSGAYTILTQGVEINIQRYAEFIHATKDLWVCCSNLDNTSRVPEISYENQKKLEALGCTVQPVYHSGEDPAWLKRYIDEGYDYIFIGGMSRESAKRSRVWLDDIWDKYLTDSTGKPTVKVHGFGLTKLSLMLRYPWYSVDSTSWLMMGIFGSCLFLDGGKLKRVIFSAENPQTKKEDGLHYDNLPGLYKDRIDGWLAEHGVTAEQCRQHFSFRNVVNARTFTLLEHISPERFRKTEIGLFDA